VVSIANTSLAANFDTEFQRAHREETKVPMPPWQLGQPLSAGMTRGQHVAVISGSHRDLGLQPWPLEVGMSANTVGKRPRQNGGFCGWPG